MVKGRVPASNPWGDPPYGENRVRYVMAGSREWSLVEPVKRVLLSLPRDAVIVTGGCRGADVLAHVEAGKMGFDREVYSARGDVHGWPAAGPIRNAHMLNLPGVAGLVAFRLPGKSNGTDDVVAQAKKLGITGRLIKPRSAHH